MSPKRYENGRMRGDVPIWTGQELDPGLWDDFRYALQGYCGERGLSSLMRQEPDTKSVDVEDNDALMSVILRFTRGEAGEVVRPFAKEGDGVSAWKALTEHCGNECKDRRQARIIECARMIEKVVCSSKEEISRMVVELDHIFGQFEDLDCLYPEELKNCRGSYE